MSTRQQIFLRQLLEAGLEFGDEDSQASKDAIAVVHALAFGGRDSLKEVVDEIIRTNEEE